MARERWLAYDYLVQRRDSKLGGSRSWGSRRYGNRTASWRVRREWGKSTRKLLSPSMLIRAHSSRHCRVTLLSCEQRTEGIEISLNTGEGQFDRRGARQRDWQVV